ncbi:MAG: cold shock domain-containing protein [Planctomycetia bacterium]|nr:cold shock domain-containing protein [Planctomycetia bacterium]
MRARCFPQPEFRKVFWSRIDTVRKWSPAVPQAKIKKILTEKGFGFIAADQGDLFFHHTEVKTGSFDQLQEGDVVEFTVGQGKKGPCATDVRRVK